MPLVIAQAILVQLIMSDLTTPRHINNLSISQFVSLSTCARRSCQPQPLQRLPPSICPWVLQIVWCSRGAFMIAVETLEIETSISFSLNELFCVGEEHERRE